MKRLRGLPDDGPDRFRSRVRLTLRRWMDGRVVKFRDTKSKRMNSQRARTPGRAWMSARLVMRLPAPQWSNAHQAGSFDR